METIIGLLFILLPVIFKLIGKKLEQSGKTDASEKMREIVEAMGEDNDESPIIEWLKEKQEVPKAPAVQLVPRPEAKPTENVKPAVKKKPKPKTPILVEEEKKKGEKIDPKKLVIYSEIMKPKFTE